MDKTLESYQNKQIEIKQYEKELQDLELKVQSPILMFDLFISLLVFVFIMTYLILYSYPTYKPEIIAYQETIIFKLYIILTLFTSASSFFLNSFNYESLDIAISKSKSNGLPEKIIPILIIGLIFPISIIVYTFIKATYISYYLLKNIDVFYKTKDYIDRIHELYSFISSTNKKNQINIQKIKKDLDIIRELQNINKGKKNTVVARRLDPLLELEKEIINEDIKAKLKRESFFVVKK